MSGFQKWKSFCYWIRNRWSCWRFLVGSGGTRAQTDLWRSSYASSEVELVIRSECLILCTCAGHCRIVSVLKVVSTFLFIMVVECGYGEECPAAVPTFCSPHLLGELWWKQLGIPAGRCNTEKGGMAKPGHCCQDTPRAITASLQQESFGSLWWSGWCSWTPTTPDIPEERPLMHFWLKNLSFIGFLESCSLEGNLWELF